ncbi:MAG TPA: DUF1501 domain-containing protein [Planctomycetaceae bacterium]|nr:DUF1501 domain-containing protein [Planctomycetaceae bacterium]
MLTIRGPAWPHEPDQRRREFLTLGGLGALGLSLPSLLQATPELTTGPGFGRAKRCLLVFLWGGPSQLDMWDMKPTAPKEIRGPLSPIATNVSGIQVSELLPQTARLADHYKIIRSVMHHHNEHSAAVSTMATGTPYPKKTSEPVAASADDHPHLGSIRAFWRGWQDGVPPFVQLPKILGPPGYPRWPGQNAGFLGRRFDPLLVDGHKETARFRLPEIDLPADVSTRRLDDRRLLLDRLDRVFRIAEADPRLDDVDISYRQAFDLIRSPRISRAVDLDRESDATRNLYGRHLFGQGLLTSRRLLEAGVPLVTQYWIDPKPAGAGGGEYDSHGRIYHHYPKRLVPPTDKALAALFIDLRQRGLLDDTLVVVMGEFGRTPKINKNAGRDHWAQCQSILLAGAGITGGSVLGSSDKIAAYPASHHIRSIDLAQTILHLLGVPSNLQLHDSRDRSIPACRGTVIPELFA